jgi:hypothetical protein
MIHDVIVDVPKIAIESKGFVRSDGGISVGSLGHWH